MRGSLSSQQRSFDNPNKARKTKISKEKRKRRQTHLYLARPFLLVSPCPPHPSPGNFLRQNLLSGTSELLSLEEEGQPAEAGVLVGEGSGGGRSAGRKEFPLERRAEKHQ